MDFITSDRTLAVGDLVIHRYTNNHLIHRIINIERRYLDKYSINYNKFQGSKIGDEWNPMVTIVQVGSFNMGASDKPKKLKKTMDASYVTKVTFQMMEDHLNRLEKMFDDLSRKDP